MTAEPKTVADLITSRAREHPDKPFLLFGSGRITYGEYLERSARVAGMMRARLPEGKPPHVGVLMGNSPEFLYLIGGAALAGAVIAVAFEWILKGKPTRAGTKAAQGTDGGE